MMRDKKFIETVEEIVKTDPRYTTEAYEFVSEAVVYTAQKLERNPHSTNRHISGHELLDGIRQYAIEQFGPMAGEILKSWGINDSISIGNIVFNMVNKKLLGANSNDSINDFKEGFDFEEAFSKPFRPDKGKKELEPPLIA